MKKNLPLAAQGVINGYPTFKNDKLLAPLQAADMLVWHIRREHEFGAAPALTLPMADMLRNEKLHLSARLERSQLEDWAAHFRELAGASPPALSKGQWQKVKRLIRALEAQGFEAPFDDVLNRLVVEKRRNRRS